jgi:nitrogen fixation NifU-like protein
MINLEQLYRQVIMDNYKNPKNKGLILKPEYRNVHLKNPSCGDDMHVSLRVEGGNILDIRHDGHGCSICCSSASVMSELLKGKSIDEANEIINDFYEMVKGNEIADEERMDEAIAYKSVSQFPARIKCATLAWKAIEEALKQNKE